MIWFTADTHFGHTGILLHQPRRLNAFESVEEMDARIISTINEYVDRNDELFHLGDFCWQASRAGSYRQRLNVRKLHIIRGNHDSNSLSKVCSTFNEILLRKFVIHGQSTKVHMLHYPMLTWDGLHHGAIHLYGHSHGRYEVELEKMYPGRRAMDIGIDNIELLYGAWRPISLDELAERFGPVDQELRQAGPLEQ